MRAKWFIQHCVILCLAWLVLTSCNNQASTRILFIGNSYTYFNGGIERQMKGLAPSISTSSKTVAGYTLENHWNEGNALRAIHQGGWSYVVLQEQSQTPVFDQQKFYQFARKFDQEIRSSGAQSILLMTWERSDSISYGVTTANLAAAYNAIGTELGAKVAPAGLAFALSLREKPDLLLYSQDGHPTVYGTYLAACVLYGTIFGRSPVGNPYSDPSITAEMRGYLQHIAAESLGY
jgi:hypothetical protein